jgi:hypothetical protein
MAHDRMFGLLVLGGIALVGGSACGSSGDVQPDRGIGALPEAPRVPAQPEVSSSGDAGRDTGLSSDVSSDAAPDAGSEGGASSDAAPPDAAPDATDAARCPADEARMGDECFPLEGPPQ